MQAAGGRLAAKRLMCATRQRDGRQLAQLNGAILPGAVLQTTYRGILVIPTGALKETYLY